MKKDAWKEKLTPEQFYVCRQKGTEPAFSGAHTHNKKKGTYYCVACKEPLFESDTKFESGSGWPSFWDALPGKLTLTEDTSLTMTRTEVCCKQCGSHLGHIFDDGPPPTGKRFCINSVALDFNPS